MSNVVTVRCETFWFSGFLTLSFVVFSCLCERRCVQTAHRTACIFSRHILNFSRREHVTQDVRGILLNAVCVFLDSHSIASMFRDTLLDAPFSTPLSTSFSTLAPGSSAFPSLLYPSKSPSTATLQGGFCFWPIG